MLRRAGYATDCVGKWHLGLGAGDIDWNGEIKPGPLEIGFDQCFILPATGDRVPCVYVENHRVANLDAKDPITVSYNKQLADEPTGREHPEQLTMKLSHGHDGTIVNGVSRIGHMTGGKAAQWNDQTMADTLAQQAIAFMEQSAKPMAAGGGMATRPFFLYLATHDVHVPRLPHSRFLGKSRCGARGDVIVEFDDTVGQVLAAIDRLGIADNTLVIVTSDNGPVVDDGYADGSVMELKDHQPAGPWRGGKYSPYEGGTRVPFIVRWPGHVKPGESPALVCQVDLLASLAALLGQTLPAAESSAGAAPSGERSASDSQSMLPALLGDDQRGRAELVEQATGPATLSLREGSWKLVPLAARGKHPTVAAGAKSAELFDLATDPAEKNSVADRHPDRVASMEARLKAIRDTPGSRGATSEAR